MPAAPDLIAIQEDIAALRRRLDALNDPRLVSVLSNLFWAETELRRVSNASTAGHTERFAR